MKLTTNNTIIQLYGILQMLGANPSFDINPDDKIDTILKLKESINDFLRTKGYRYEINENLFDNCDYLYDFVVKDDNLELVKLWTHYGEYDFYLIRLGTSTDENGCGDCGTSTELAFIPPIGFKLASMFRRRKRWWFRFFKRIKAKIKY